MNINLLRLMRVFLLTSRFAISLTGLTSPLVAMLLTASFFGLKIQAFLILLIPLTLAYPHCNPALYGTPKENSCHDIFFDRPWTGNKGLESLDKKTHYFGAVGNPRTRPADVERGQWARPVDLPRTWHSGTFLHPTASQPEY